jgi:hypothetical protein
MCADQHELGPVEDIFESGTLSNLIVSHLRRRGHEKARVEVMLRNGESFDVAQMAVTKGFLMFLTDDPDELVFVPAHEVVKIHVRKLEEEHQVGFMPEPFDPSDEAAARES